MSGAADLDPLGSLRRSADGFAFIDVVLDDTLRNWNHAGYVSGGRAAARLDVTNVRSGVCFRPQTEKENVDAARGFQCVDVADQFRFEVRRISLHRIEA